jgi:uncharacterized protein (TIGR02145 family)
MNLICKLCITFTGLLKSFFMKAMICNFMVYAATAAFLMIIAAACNKNKDDTPGVTLPSVTTKTVSDITATSASTGGYVSGDGGSTVTERGVCYGTLQNPTIADEVFVEGGGTGNFTCELTDLLPDTSYYVRAYAINSAGIAYGSQVSFHTLQVPFNCGDVVSYEGQDYATVLIGNQCWFRQNLNVGVMIDGSTSQTDNGLTEKYCYNNEPSKCEVYGGLYQWNELMQYTTTEGIKGLCPEGWHIPTQDEWYTLVDFLGGVNTAGAKLKDGGVTYWKSPNTGATNSSGFTGLPGGMLVGTGMTFAVLSEEADFWTSSLDDYYGTTHPWSWHLYYNQVYTNPTIGFRTNGYSVRCLKD